MQLVVARVGRAHGVHGEVTVEVRTDSPQLRLAAGAVLATDPPGLGPLVVTSQHDHSGRLLLRFAGVDSRDAAEALRGVMLLVEVDPAERPEDDEEFYDHQLVGLVAVDEAGAELGTVSEVLHLPAQEVLVIARPGGAEALVPFVASIVPTVDLAAGRLVVTPPPGLLDEEPAP